MYPTEPGPILRVSAGRFHDHHGLYFRHLTDLHLVECPYEHSLQALGWFHSLAGRRWQRLLDDPIQVC